MDGQLSSLGDAEGHVGGHGPLKKGGRKNCRFICRSFPTCELGRRYISARAYSEFVAGYYL